MALKPTPEDRLAFGLWTVGWEARDQFGDASRAPLDPIEAVHKLAELGVWGMTFHDDDLVPFGSDDSTRRGIIDSLKKARSEERRVGKECGCRREPAVTQQHS